MIVAKLAPLERLVELYGRGGKDQAELAKKAKRGSRSDPEKGTAKTLQER